MSFLPILLESTGQLFLNLQDLSSFFRLFTYIPYDIQIRMACRSVQNGFSLCCKVFLSMSASLNGVWWFMNIKFPSNAPLYRLTTGSSTESTYPSPVFLLPKFYLFRTSLFLFGILEDPEDWSIVCLRGDLRTQTESSSDYIPILLSSVQKRKFGQFSTIQFWYWSF